MITVRIRLLNRSTVFSKHSSKGQLYHMIVLVVHRVTRTHPTWRLGEDSSEEASESGCHQHCHWQAQCPQKYNLPSLNRWPSESDSDSLQVEALADWQRLSHIPIESIIECEHSSNQFLKMIGLLILTLSNQLSSKFLRLGGQNRSEQEAAVLLIVLGTRSRVPY